MTDSHLPATTIKDVRNFLLIGKIEGYSFLVLLLIAMPLKYLADWPLAVRYTGMLHGILFVAFMYTIAVLFQKKIFNWLQALFAVALSLIPFGTFFLHRLLPRNKE